MLGGQGEGLCCGARVPVLGRISMDATMFDVTDVPNIEKWLEESVISIPFSIQVINEELTLPEISKRNRSLGYELLTSLSSNRYSRAYISTDNLECEYSNDCS